MPFDLVYLPQPDEALDRLAADPGQDDLLRAVEYVLADLSENPTSPRLGSKTWAVQRTGVVHSTPVRRDGWQIVWKVLSSSELEIIFIGPEHPS